jgi:hypothetical protein
VQSYDRASFERLVLNAFNKLFTSHGGQEGEWIASLGKFGAFEVRFVRITSAMTDELTMWAALYSPEVESTISTCSFATFDEAVVAVESLVAQAMRPGHRAGFANNHES